MKSVSKNSFSDALANPISRNLIIIFITTLIAAIALVTTTIVLYAQ